MEIALLSTLLSKTFRDVTAEGFQSMGKCGRNVQKEAFATATTSKATPIPKKKESKRWIWILVLIIWGISSLVGIYSAYLSWKTNTLFDMPTGQKVIFAICAFFGGILYLILYYAFRYSDVQYVRSMKGMVGPERSPERAALPERSREPESIDEVEQPFEQAIEADPEPFEATQEEMPKDYDVPEDYDVPKDYDMPEDRTLPEDHTLPETPQKSRGGKKVRRT